MRKSLETSIFVFYCIFISKFSNLISICASAICMVLSHICTFFYYKEFLMISGLTTNQSVESHLFPSDPKSATPTDVEAEMERLEDSNNAKTEVEQNLKANILDAMQKLQTISIGQIPDEENYPLESIIKKEETEELNSYTICQIEYRISSLVKIK